MQLKNPQNIEIFSGKNRTFGTECNKVAVKSEFSLFSFFGSKADCQTAEECRVFSFLEKCVGVEYFRLESDSTPILPVLRKQLPNLRNLKVFHLIENVSDSKRCSFSYYFTQQL